MEIRVHSIPATVADRAAWPGPEKVCPRCGQSFGAAKKRRLPNGVVIHNRCTQEGDVR